MSVRNWLACHGCLALVLLLWLCFVCTPTTYVRTPAAKAPWVVSETDWSNEEIGKRLGLATLAGVLLGLAWYLSARPAPIEPALAVEAPRWRRIIESPPGGLGLFSVMAFVAATGVVLAVCRNMPIVDFGLLFRGELTGQNLRPYTDWNRTYSADLVYPPNATVIDFRLMVAGILLSLMIVGWYLVSVIRRNQYRKAMQDAELLRI